MDERELTRLFQDAADDAPPAGFDVKDVTTASRRTTARRRMRIAAVASIAAVVLGGAGFVAATGSFTGSGGESLSATAGRAASDQAAQPAQQDMRLENGDPRKPPVALSMQGDGAARAQAGTAAGLTGTERCEAVDRRLATALAGELPVVPDDPQPVPGRLCAADGRNAAYRVADGDASGLVMVAYLPGQAEATVTLAGRATVATARTSSGGVVVVASVPDGGSPTAPFAGRVQRIADAVAATR